MEYNKVRTVQKDPEEESNHYSGKSSSEERKSRDIKNDQWEKERYAIFLYKHIVIVKVLKRRKEKDLRVEICRKIKKVNFF
jgi:hypothetical protein